MGFSREFPEAGPRGAKCFERHYFILFPRKIPESEYYVIFICEYYLGNRAGLCVRDILFEFILSIHIRC